MGWEDIPGWTDGHIQDLYAWAVGRMPADAPACFVEVGVAFGRSLALAASLVAESGKVVHLVGVDAWEPEAWVRESPELMAIIDAAGGFHEAAAHYLADHHCGLWRMSSVEAAGRWPDYSRVFAAKKDPSPPLRFVFLDANHAYQSVLEDLHAWWPLVESGGAMAGHDHTPSYPGVERACREFFGPAGYEQRGSCFLAVKP